VSTVDGTLVASLVIYNNSKIPLIFEIDNEYFLIESKKYMRVSLTEFKYAREKLKRLKMYEYDKTHRRWDVAGQGLVNTYVGK
jgi:hypothetical protein